MAIDAVLARLPLVVALLGAWSCDPGPPRLARFEVVASAGAGTGAGSDLAHPGATTPASFPPASAFRAVFTRRLDAAKLEAAGVATATWAGAPAIVLTAAYDAAGSLKTMPPGPAINLVAAPADAALARGSSLPSASTIAIELQIARITGTNDEPFIGPHTFEVITDSFSATLGLPTVPAAPSQTLKVNLNNFPRLDTLAGIKITRRGEEVSGVAIAADEGAPSITIAGPRVDDANVRRFEPGDYVVDVPATLADVYGVPLGEAGKTTGRFTIASSSDASPPDAGTADAAGATD